MIHHLTGLAANKPPGKAANGMRGDTLSVEAVAPCNAGGEARKAPLANLDGCHAFDWPEVEQAKESAAGSLVEFTIAESEADGESFLVRIASE